MHGRRIINFFVLPKKLKRKRQILRQNKTSDSNQDWCDTDTQSGEQVSVTTAAADCLSQSTAPSDLLGSRGHGVQREPHRGSTGAKSSHDASVTRRRDS